MSKRNRVHRQGSLGDGRRGPLPAIPGVPRIWALLGVLVVCAVPARALNIIFIPRSQAKEPVNAAALPELTLGEVKLNLGNGSEPQPIQPIQQLPGPVEVPVLPQIPPDQQQMQPQPDQPPPPSDQGQESPSGSAAPSSIAGSVQVPSAGAPAAGASGVPGMGWGSGLPSEPTTGAFKGLHGSLQVTGHDQTVDGDATRSTHVSGTAYREDGMVSFDEFEKDALQLRLQAAMRYTDDQEVVSDGNRFRMENQFLEVGRAHDFLLRAGDVTPQFTNYAFSKTGQGVHFIKDLERPDGLVQVQFFGARTQRQKDPGAFERESTGLRAARVWTVGKNEGHVGLGVQGVNVTDDLNSISLVGAAGIPGFPSDRIFSTNGFYDNRQGFHSEGEWAESRSEMDTTGVKAARRGTAQRQSIGYTRSGKNITIEHERVEPTFDAVDGGASLDIDRQSVFITVPFSPMLTLTSFYQRVYNDVRGQIGRTGQNKTYNLGLTSQPFARERSEWLKGISLGVIGGFSSSTASDGSTDRFDRDYTYSVADTIRRLTLSYQLRSASDFDYLAIANSRAPNHSSYQASYDIPGPKGRWTLAPFLNLGHDHDRDISTGTLDRSNDLSVGLNGSYGQRSTFTAHRDERIQRNVTAMRQSFQEIYQGEFNYQFDPAGDLKTNLQYLQQTNSDTGLLGQSERRVLLSLAKIW